ncbi:MAG TPA: hypothetical protein VF516_07235 [Kofleriaceae bacterium]
MASACGVDGPEFSADHPRIYMKSRKDALVAALQAGQPEAKRFKDMVDGWVGGGDVYNFFSWNAALLGQLTGDPKYCAAAIKDVEQQVNDATSQVNGGQLPFVAHDSYLDVGNLIGNLALVYDWCAESLPADRRGAWLSYADQAVYNVWNPDVAKWGNLPDATWSGFAIDDPSDNYFYSFLRATMLLGLAAHDETPRAKGWLSEFRDTKLAGELVPVFDMQLVGGGSREGTGSGVSQRDLFELYDLWKASTGEPIADLTPHTRASMLAMIHQIVPTLDRIAPTGDQSRDSLAQFFDYHRSYLQDLIALYSTDPVAPHAQALLASSSLPQMSQQFMYASDFLYANRNVTATALDGLGTAYFAPGIGEVYARSGWDKHATWVNLIAGPYSQSHAHQDQGSLMIYKDGWLAYDVVIDSHSGVNPPVQATSAHSLVRIVDASGKTVAQQAKNLLNPDDQSKPDSKVVALHRPKGAGFLHVAADLTAAYGGQSTVQQVQREIVYLEPSTVIVYDRLATKVGTQVVFQLVSPVSPPTATGTTHTFTTAGHTLTLEDVGPVLGMPAIFDFAKSDSSEFMGGFRLDEPAPGGNNVRFLHVLTIDGAATGIVQGDTPGDSVKLTVGGQDVVMTFNHDAIGGTLTIGTQSFPLGASLDPLPE